MAFALATSVYLLGFGLPEIPKIVLVRALIYLAVLLMTEFIRRQLEPHAAPARWAWILAFSLLPLTSFLEGFFGVRGALLHHGTLTFLQAVMVFELHRLYQRAGGRGIRIIGVGILVALLMNLTQIASLMIGPRHYQPVAETPEGLALYLANILCVMLYSIGFWSYSLDLSKKAELESAVVRAAELERRKIAEASAEEMAKVVRERNVGKWADRRQGRI